MKESFPGRNISTAKANSIGSHWSLISRAYRQCGCWTSRENCATSTPETIWTAKSKNSSASEAEVRVPEQGSPGASRPGFFAASSLSLLPSPVRSFHFGLSVSRICDLSSLLEYGLAHQPALASRTFSGHRMERLEGDRLARQRDFFFPFLRPVVRDRKKETGGGADGLLVAEPGGLVFVALLCLVLQTGFRIHFCLRLYLDSLRSQPDHPSATQGGPPALPRLRSGFASLGQLLRPMRSEAGGVNCSPASRRLRPYRYFPVLRSDGGGAGAGCATGPVAAGLMPYFSRMGVKSGWSWANPCN